MSPKNHVFNTRHITLFNMYSLLLFVLVELREKSKRHVLKITAKGKWKGASGTTSSFQIIGDVPQYADNNSSDGITE